MSPLFDAYLMVDWSANSGPKTGRDSIWWCHQCWVSGSLELDQVRNPATRREAWEQIKAVLLDYAQSARRILVGFDIAYAYPAGFAQTLLPGKTPPWLALWRYLAEQMDDDAGNTNNRFAVAAQINAQVSGCAAPFWGCPENRQTATLSMRKPKGEAAELVAEFRLTEQGNRTHSVWKLAYPGAVGGQVLMGLPYVYALRMDPGLAGVSRVWPFETGLRPLQGADLTDIRIIHAEVYPSLVPLAPGPGEVKDRCQVMALAEHLAGLDEAGRLGAWFGGRRPLTPHDRHLVETEEGWILGV
jgi:precorrin-8X/cobalt-precorrin-8 methylmutase